MVKLSIIFPSDPFGKKVGGAETYIRDLIKFTPEDIDIEFIGVTTDKKERPVKKWSQCRLGDKNFKFYPLFSVGDENKKGLIPLSFRFTLSLAFSGLDFNDKILFLNRIEPALALMRVHGHKIGVVHNDIRQQVGKKGREVLWNKFPWLYYTMEDLIFGSMGRVFTVSHNTLEFFRQRFPGHKDKFIFLPTWVDKASFFPVEGTKPFLRKDPYFSEWSLPADKKWLLFVGRLQEQKAPLRLIDTFFEYKKIDSASCLVVIGEGDLKGKVEEHIKELGLEKDVFLLGRIPIEEEARFYRASDVLLLTSNYEGMPLTVMEALACGLPVVSTDVGEIKNILKKECAGEAVASFKPQDIAVGVEKVLGDAYLYSGGTCVVDSVAAFTPQNILRPLFELIRRWAKERDRYVRLLGVRYDNVTRAEAIREAISFLEAKQRSSIFFLNIDCLQKAQKDKEYMRILTLATLVLPDGIGINLLTKHYGRKMKENCQGSDLSPMLMAEAAKKNYKIFFLGAEEGIAEKAASAIRRKIPGINIVGTHSGYFGDTDGVIREINSSGADILFVSMGVPLQERWIARNREKLDPCLCLGVGALFEFLSGHVKRAPLVFQKLKMEWLWRIAMEPKRLWRRYLGDDLKFFINVLKRKR